jgi:thymidylate kinase
MFSFLNNNKSEKKFIVLEGVDGSGKTTAAHYLADHLGY